MTFGVFSWHTDQLVSILGRRSALPHALLIHGREGMGKVEFARALAQSLLCESPDTGGLACGECPACHWFVSGNHPDFRELVPESLQPPDTQGEDRYLGDDSAKVEKKSAQITIDQVRELSRFMTLSTHRDGYRVLLVRPAEALNPAAANALLKTLEEPAKNTLIMLVADRPGRLLPTIRSRCQSIAVGAPTAETALAWLRSEAIESAEAVLAQASGAPLLAREWADPEFQASRGKFLDALGAPGRGDWASLAASLEKSDLRRVVYWLQTWCSDLILQKTVARMRHHTDYQKVLEQLAERATLPLLFRFESQLRETRRFIGHPLNAKLLLEQMLLSYALAVRPSGG